MMTDGLTCLMVHHLPSQKASHVLKALRMMLEVTETANSVAHRHHPACAFWKLKLNKIGRHVLVSVNVTKQQTKSKLFGGPEKDHLFVEIIRISLKV